MIGISACHPVRKRTNMFVDAEFFHSQQMAERVPEFCVMGSASFAACSVLIGGHMFESLTAKVTQSSTPGAT
jgi:hypothetical protein